ncbi:helix-turn-helix transcriptional regulator [Streptomyces sp.]|uniref:helix-turn-helix domain-containing protein n=1 Tax=Streptomyces sp. TaxID=1931 RepID=UPI002F93FC8D
MTEQGPTTRQRRLSAELRRLREEAGLTPEQAAGAIGWSRPKLVKIELATSPATVGDVERILSTYGGTDEAVKLALMQLARDVRKRGWWAAYGDVLAGSYAELEDAASHIRIWQVQLIPGLLQTQAYARAIITSGGVTDPEEVARRVEVRLHRQALLVRPDAPRLDIVLAEEVLHRPEPGAMMAEQMHALLAVAERPNVTLRVVPRSAGLFPGVGQGSLITFEFPGPVDLSVAYLETMAGGMYLEDVAQVRRCNVSFDGIAAAALSERASADLIAAVAGVQSKE